MFGKVTSPCQLHQPVGFAGCAPTVSRTIECRPSAPINRSPSADLPSSNSTRTPLCVLTTFDRTTVASDTVSRKAFQQSFEQDSTRDHPNRCAQPVNDRGQVQSGDRATPGRHDPHGRQQLTGVIHIDTQLLQNRRAIGPNRHGAATWPHIRPPFEDSDVMSVAQQSPRNGNAAHTGADNEDPKRPSRRRVRYWHQLRPHLHGAARNVSRPSPANGVAAER